MDDKIQNHYYLSSQIFELIVQICQKSGLYDFLNQGVSNSKLIEKRAQHPALCNSTLLLAAEVTVPWILDGLPSGKLQK